MGITGKIYGINGPVITIQGNPGYKMNEMVYVGEHRLVGEVIRLSKEKTTIQVYEETSGLKPGEEVAGAGCAISVKLAPGILNNIFDGIENGRPPTFCGKETYRFCMLSRCAASPPRLLSITSTDSFSYPEGPNASDIAAHNSRSAIFFIPSFHFLLPWQRA